MGSFKEVISSNEKDRYSYPQADVTGSERMVPLPSVGALVQGFQWSGSIKAWTIGSLARFFSFSKSPTAGGQLNQKRAISARLAVKICSKEAIAGPRPI